MHLDASQALKGTLCFLCTSSSTDSVLLQSTLPPHLPWTKQVMLMLVLGCWQGQQEYNLSLPIPDEPADEWHITANAPTVPLSGKWDKDERFVRAVPCPCLFGHQIFSQCGWTGRAQVLFIAVNHLPVSLLEFHFMEEECGLLCASCQERGVLFHGDIHQACARGEIKHPFYQEISWLLSWKMQYYQLLWGKVPLDDVLANLICKEHSLLWIRDAAACTTQWLKCWLVDFFLLAFSTCPH